MSIAVNLRSKAVIKSFLGRFKDTLRNQFRYWEHEDIKAIIDAKDEETELIFTGTYLKEELIQYADAVYEIKLIKED